MLETLATKTGNQQGVRRPGGAFDPEELARIDLLLREGMTNRAVCDAMKIPEATFYFRLKRSKKKIVRPDNSRCLGDLQESGETSDV